LGKVIEKQQFQKREKAAGLLTEKERMENKRGGQKRTS